MPHRQALESQSRFLLFPGSQRDPVGKRDSLDNLTVRTADISVEWGNALGTGYGLLADVRESQQDPSDGEDCCEHVDQSHPFLASVSCHVNSLLDVPPCEDEEDKGRRE